MRGFREVGWVAAVAGTALGCYMVSLKVASERASLEQVENRIVLAQRDIRVLQTEIGTRGRLEQLESWNVKVLALSAPQAQQFLEGEFQLATLAAPKKTIDPGAPVVLAAAPAPASQGSATTSDDADSADQRGGGPTANELMHIASFKRDLPASNEKAVDKPQLGKPKAVKASAAPATAPVKVAAKAVAVTSTKAAPAVGTKAEPKAKPKPPVATAAPKEVKARQ
jgi:hypothetical protein